MRLPFFFLPKAKGCVGAGQWPLTATPRTLFRHAATARPRSPLVLFPSTSYVVRVYGWSADWSKPARTTLVSLVGDYLLLCKQPLAKVQRSSSMWASSETSSEIQTFPGPDPTGPGAQKPGGRSRVLAAQSFFYIALLAIYLCICWYRCTVHAREMCAFETLLFRVDRSGAHSACQRLRRFSGKDRGRSPGTRRCTWDSQGLY